MSIVVSISGPAGVGKTTLCRELQGRFGDAAYVSFDDFRTRECFPSDIEKWIREGVSLQAIKSPLYAQALLELKQGKPYQHPTMESVTYGPAGIILTDEPFGRERPEIGPLLDLVVFLDVPLDIGLVRAVRRKTGYLRSQCDESAQEGILKGHVEMLASTIDSFLDMYQQVSRPLYCKVNSTVPAGCDAVMDGTRPVEALTDAVMKLVREKLQYGYSV